MSEFKISSEKLEDEAVITCWGELDLMAASDVETHLREVEAAGVKRIVIDLSPLEFLDSTGLRVLIAADSRARRQGRQLAIIPGPEPVHRVFRIALLDRRFDFVYPDAGGEDGE